MILSAFLVPLIVPLHLGLASGQLYPDSKVSVSVVCQDDRCSTQNSTLSTSQAEATFDVGSDLLNISGSVEFTTVTVTVTVITATTTCPTTQISWNQSTSNAKSSRLFSASNQTFPSSNYSPTHTLLSDTQSTSQPSLTTIGTSLIFDHNTAPRVLATAANASTFTGAGSRYRPTLSDSLVFLLAGVVQMGMA